MNSPSCRIQMSTVFMTVLYLENIVSRSGALTLPKPLEFRSLSTFPESSRTQTCPMFGLVFLFFINMISLRSKGHAEKLPIGCYNRFNPPLTNIKVEEIVHQNPKGFTFPKRRFIQLSSIVATLLMVRGLAC